MQITLVGENRITTGSFTTLAATFDRTKANKIHSDDPTASSWKLGKGALFSCFGQSPEPSCTLDGIDAVVDSVEAIKEIKEQWEPHLPSKQRKDIKHVGGTNNSYRQPFHYCRCGPLFSGTRKPFDVRLVALDEPPIQPPTEPIAPDAANVTGIDHFGVPVPDGSMKETCKQLIKLGFTEVYTMEGIPSYYARANITIMRCGALSLAILEDYGKNRPYRPFSFFHNAYGSKPCYVALRVRGLRQLYHQWRKEGLNFLATVKNGFPFKVATKPFVGIAGTFFVLGENGTDDHRDWWMNDTMTISILNALGERLARGDASTFVS